MADAYVAATSNRPHLCSPPLSPILAATEPSYTAAPSPLRQTPFPPFHDFGGHGLKDAPARLRARIPMPSEIAATYHAHWLSRLRSALRLLVLVLSGGVTVMLVHSLEIFRGNTYLDLRKGELPMTWPARTNLAPTLILCAIATANFLASVAVLTLSFTRSFRRPIRSRDLYRIVAGSFSVVLWATALVTFNFLDKASKASLGRYACTNKNVMSNGRYQYRAVCEEQGVAFYLAIGAASAELVTLLTLGLSALLSAKQKQPHLIKSDHEKKNSISFGVTGRSP